MKRIFIYALFTLISTISMAQSAFNFAPTPATVNSPASNQDTTAEIEVTNTTANPLTLKWERMVINITQGCLTQICDPNLCYLPQVSTKTFMMDPNDIDTVIVHFLNPTGISCDALVHIKLTNQGNPSDTQTAIYVWNQTSGTDDLTQLQVRVFPNPTADFFSIDKADDVAKIKVYAMTGQVVAEFSVQDANLYDIQNQPAGQYIISLENNSGRVIGAETIVKK